MAKQKHGDPLPLFPDLSWKTSDERKYESQQVSKRNAKRLVSIAPAPTHGPACLRCTYWMRPVDARDFGKCRALGIAESASPYGNVDKGDVVPQREARDLHKIATVPLNTREGFHCGAFKDYREEAA